MFIVLVSRKVPGIVQYAFYVYKLLINAYYMPCEAYAGWRISQILAESCKGDSPIPSASSMSLLREGDTIALGKHL